MRLISRLAAFMIGGLVAFPLLAADEKKPDEKKPDEKAPELVKAGVLVGKVISVDETKRKIRLHIEVPEFNQGAANAIANENVELQKVLASERNPQTRATRIAQIQQNIAKHQRELYKAKGHDIDVQTAEEVKVRLKNPPVKFDEKGKVTKYTEKELKDLRGDDPKLPGYSGEFADVRPNVYIEVHLMKKKGAPALPKTDPKIKDAEKLELIKTLTAEYAPQATLIVVVAEPLPGM